MSWEAWFTLGVVAAAMVVLVKDLLPPGGAMVAALVAVLTAGVVEPGEAFSGFSNPAPITIAALYVLAKAVEKTGALTPFVARILGQGGDRAALARLTAPTTAASAFLNNSPIVAMLVPEVEQWSEQRGRSPSDLLMPLSFAAILGGLITVMGTASNIIVSGLLEAAGEDPLGFFEITKVGLPVAVVGLVVLVASSSRLLPSRRSARAGLTETAREFTVEMAVVGSGMLDGSTVEDGGLRHLRGVYLVQVDRADDVIAPVAPDTVLRGGDVLRFVGRVDEIVDLQNKAGLAPAVHHEVADLQRRPASHFEGVLGASSPLIGKTIRESGFRGRYQAAVLAVHRAGQRLSGKLGNIRLRVGDTLLLLSDPEFGDRWRDRRDFLLVSRLGRVHRPTSPRAALVALVAAGIAVAAATGLAPLVTSAVVGATLLVILKVVTPGEARDAVDLDVILTIAAAFGLAEAMARSGLADDIARWLVDGLRSFGEAGVLGGVVVATVIIKELITNKAAVLLIMPVALSSGAALGLEPRGIAVAIAIAAGASFLTPIGAPTNTMVYGPGGYRFTDYLRLGVPLTVVAVVGIMILVPVFWSL